jgi:hypothetical protein
MAAEPEYYPSTPAPGPDDPSEILRLLPAMFHERFLSEYRQAVLRAQDVEWYPNLAGFLRFWHLRALAYSDPAYAEGLRATRDSLRTGSLEGWISLDEVVAQRRSRNGLRGHVRGTRAG